MSTTILSELTRFAGEVGTNNYQEYKRCVIREIHAKKVKQYVPREWTTYFYPAMLTNAQYDGHNGIVHKRLINLEIANDDPLHATKRKDQRNEQTAVDAVTLAIRSKLSSTAITELDAISYAN